MVPDSNIRDRNVLGPVLTEASIGGILLGIAVFLAKVSLDVISLDIFFLIHFLSNPVSWLSMASGVAGFILFQKSLHSENMSVVTPVVGGLSIIVPIILALLFLGETISIIKWAGIALIMAGVLFLGGKD